MTTIRVVLPYQLYTLARCDSAKITREFASAATGGAALETAYPALVGALRGRSTGQRPPLIRFHDGGGDFSRATPTPRCPAPSAQAASCCSSSARLPVAERAAFPHSQESR